MQVGALTGAAGSLMGSLTWLIPGIQTNGWGTAVQVGTSSAFGGVVADLSGGNFWEGVAQAAIIAGFNHAAHTLSDGIEERRASRRFRLEYEKAVHDQFYEAGKSLVYRNGELKWETYD